MTNPTPEQRARECLAATVDAEPMSYYDERRASYYIRDEQGAKIWAGTAIRAMLTFSHTGVEQAIEACAKVAEGYGSDPEVTCYVVARGALAEIAAAIRATLPAQSPDDIAYAGAVQGERYCNHAATYRRPDTGETGPIYCVNCAPKNLKAASPVNVEGLVEALRPFAAVSLPLEHRCFLQVLLCPPGDADEHDWRPKFEAARSALASLSPDGER